MKDRILIIVPTRRRPQSVKRLVGAFWATCRGFADLMFAVDDDDPAESQYVPSIHKLSDLSEPDMTIHCYVGPRRKLGPTLNALAVEMAKQYKTIGFMGDDHVPRTQGWDARFRECLSGGSGIVYGNDLLQGERMPTAVAMSADIVNKLGYMVPPGLVHLNIDLVWRDWGRGMGRMTYLHDVIIEHMHPHNGKSTMDVGYSEVNSTSQINSDGGVYEKYKRERLPADLAHLHELL